MGEKDSLDTDEKAKDCWLLILAIQKGLPYEEIGLPQGGGYGSSNSDFVHGFLHRRRVLQSRKCVDHTNENCGSIWRANKIGDST